MSSEIFEIFSKQKNLYITLEVALWNSVVYILGVYDENIYYNLYSRDYKK